MWCLASNQWLHARQQHRGAHNASPQINGCTRTVAASFGTHDASHRVSCCMQWLQRSLACGASLHSQGHVPTGYRQLPGGLRQIPARSDLRQAIGPFSFSPPLLTSDWAFLARQEVARDPILIPIISESLGLTDGDGDPTGRYQYQSYHLYNHILFSRTRSIITILNSLSAL